jgi:hypothetical protein
MHFFVLFIYLFTHSFLTCQYATSGQDRVVGIATRHGLDGPAIEFRWGRNFPSLSDRFPDPPTH